MIPIAISTLEINPEGAHLIFADETGTSLGDFVRRVQRTATLGGGAILTDNGYTHADRTVRVDLTDQPREVQEAIRNIVELYSAVILMLPDGAYRASPERYIAAGRVTTLTLLIAGPAEVRP